MSSPWRLAAQEAIWKREMAGGILPPATLSALEDLPIGAASFRMNYSPEKCLGDAAKAIDAAYPFNERAYHPYKIWLDERKKTLLRLGLWQPPKNRRCKYHPDGQTCLICQGEQ